ncbi:unknown [Prevotella sp. CAG:732]|nr:unknown [Prevotella sp. CAG:732]
MRSLLTSVRFFYNKVPQTSCIPILITSVSHILQDISLI